MELVRGFTSSPRAPRGCGVTIGTFDGLHRGHRALVDRLKEQSASLGLPSVLLTFEPTPREYFSPADPPARLTSLRERWRILSQWGLDYLWLLRFGERLRNLSPEEFAAFLAREVRARRVVVGHDFRFGKGGLATAATLRAAGGRLGFEVDVIEPVKLADGARISSSGVRAALAHAGFRAAADALGRAYSMRGRVVWGERLGRKLGFPTANLALERRRAPLAGIFAVRVRGAAAGVLPGVASLGTRPTIGGTTALLEAHLFDFDADLYGREIEVEFAAKLRDEERFATLEALVVQMRLDAEAARAALAVGGRAGK
jgi:riboflavin kinase/FMN adenylyltransferase